MATQAEIVTALAELRLALDRLDPTGNIGAALATESAPDGRSTLLTLRAADLGELERGEILTVLGSTKGEVLTSLRMMFEGATLAVSAAEFGKKRETRA